jgi:hypothetical protein
MWLFVRSITSFNVMVVIVQLFLAMRCGNAECTSEVTIKLRCFQSIWLWLCVPYIYPKVSQGSSSAVFVPLCLNLGVLVFGGLSRRKEEVQVFLPFYTVGTMFVMTLGFSNAQLLRGMFRLHVCFAKEQANALEQVFNDLSLEPIQSHVRLVGELVTAGSSNPIQTKAKLDQLQQLLAWQTFYAERSVIAFQVIKGERTLPLFDTNTTVPIRRVLHAAELMFFSNPHHSPALHFELRFDPDVAQWVRLPEMLVLHGLRVLLDSAIKQTKSGTLVVRMTETNKQELLFEVKMTGTGNSGHSKMSTDAMSGRGDVNWRRVPVSQQSLNLWLLSKLLAAAGGSFGVSRLTGWHGQVVSSSCFRVPFTASDGIPNINIPSSWRQVR